MFRFLGDRRGISTGSLSVFCAKKVERQSVVESGYSNSKRCLISQLTSLLQRRIVHIVHGMKFSPAVRSHVAFYQGQLRPKQKRVREFGPSSWCWGEAISAATKNLHRTRKSLILCGLQLEVQLVCHRDSKRIALSSLYSLLASYPPKTALAISAPFPLRAP